MKTFAVSFGVLLAIMLGTAFIDAQGRRSPAEGPARGVEEVREVMTHAMEKAARSLGITLDPDSIYIASTPAGVVADATGEGSDNSVGVVYNGVPGGDLPPGFYRVRSLAGSSRVVLIDPQGKQHDMPPGRPWRSTWGR